MLLGSGLLVAIGILLFLGFGIALPPLADSLGVGLAQVMAFSSISLVTQAAVMSLAGPRLIERFDVRPVVLVGGLISGTALYSVSFVSGLAALYLLAIVAGSMLGLVSQLASTVLVHRWFVRRRGTMLGIVMGLSGLGGVFAGSLLPGIIADGGWQRGFRVMGGTFAVVSVLCVVLLIRNRPEDVGLRPYGGRVEEASPDAAGQRVGVRAAIGSPQFVALCGGLLLFNAVLAVQQHFTPLLVDNGLAGAAAGALISVLAAVNVASTLGLGILIDRIGSLPSLLLTAGLLAASFLVFRFTVGTGAQLLAMLLLSPATVLAPVFTPVVFRGVFGRLGTGPLLGVGLATMPVGVAIGSPLWGLASDLSGGYDEALLIALVVVGVATLGIGYAVRSGSARSAALASEQ